jgi:hypothetical protein
MFGTFEVVTTPAACEVYLGTHRFGATPVHVQNMPMGQHELRLAKEGYKSENVDLEILPGGHTILDLPLEKPEDFHRGRIRPGVEIGVSYVYLSYSLDNTSNLVDDRGQFHFSIGAFLDLALTPNVFLSPGLRYARLGNEATYRDSTLVEKETVQGYLSMPLLLKAFPFSSSGWFVTGGVEIGVLTDAKQLTDDGVERAIFVRDYNISLDLGGGLEVPTLGHTTFVQLQFSLGLESAFDAASTNWRTGELKLSGGFIW